MSSEALNVAATEKRSRPRPHASSTGERSPIDGTSLLAAADLLAHEWVEAAAPVRFEVVESDAVREEIFRLRFEVISGRGWADPGTFPDGLEHDSYDEDAVHLAGTDGNRLAATTRLVFPRPGRRLPTEDAFGIVVEPEGEVVDVNRVIVCRNPRRPTHSLFCGLLGSLWLEVRARGFSHICGDFTTSVIRLYQAIGFEVRRLGAAHQYWGEERYPITLDIPASVPTLRRRWARRAGYGETPNS